MTEIDKIINQLEVDYQRAERRGDAICYINRKTVRDALSILKEFKKGKELSEEYLKSLGITKQLIDI